MERVTCDGDGRKLETGSEKADLEVESDDGPLSAVKCLRLKNSLMEILEELKLRRINDKENEERIKRATQEKYDLNRKCDAEILKLNEAREKFQKQIHDDERKYREKYSQLEEQLKQQIVFKGCTEKEINSLKDEIRNLEVVKYTLEKDLKEQERKLQLYVQSSEQHLNQLTETDKKFKALHLHCKQLGEAQAQLEDSVQHAVNHNQSLMYINEHQKCILNEEKKHVLSLQSQLLEVKCRLQQKPDKTSLQQYQQEVTSLNQKLEKVKAEKERASKEIDEYAAKNEKVSQLLQETHQLLGHQIEIAEIHKRNSSQQKLVISQHQEELDQVKGELLEVKDNIALLKDQHKEDVEEWRKKNSYLQDDLSKIMDELSEGKKRCDDLGDLNTALSNQNIQLTEQLQLTKELLNKPKQEQIQQTELSLMNMVDQESQVEVNSVDTLVQTDSVPPKTSSTQTPVPELTVSRTQTNNPALANSSSQTEKPEVQSMSVQAEIIKYNSKERLFCKSMSSASSVCRSLSQESQSVSENACQVVNVKILSDSQPQQESLSVCDSYPNIQSLSDDSHQLVQLPHPDDAQSTLELSDKLVESVSTEQNCKKIKMDVSGHESEQPNEVKRKTFQLPENTIKEPDTGKEIVLSQENTVSRNGIEDGNYVVNANTIFTTTLNIPKITSPGVILKSEPEIKAKSKKIEVIVVPNPSQPAPVVQDQADAKEVYKPGDKPDQSNAQLTNSADHPSDSEKTCISPRSPGGSRLKLSLSRLKTSKATPTGLSDDITVNQDSSQTVEPVDSLTVSTSPHKEKEETSEIDSELKDMKGILRGSGQEGLLTRKHVTFGSPLQDVHQISQTSVESVSHDDGDKELFSDSDEDMEDGSFHGGRNISDKCLPPTSTTLIIHGKKVESTNSLANCVDKFLPETSPSKSLTTELVADDDDTDLDISTTCTAINKEQRFRKSINSASAPLNRDMTSVSGTNRMFPALDIPKVPEISLSNSTLSNQYKRTIDAILNKGKKLKTDKV